MLTDKRQIRLLEAMALLMYFSSYVTRINYAAVMVEIVAAESLATTDAALVVTATTICYGGGQLLSGFVGDKLNPRLLIFWGLLATVSCNLLLPLCTPQVPLMVALWGVNGLAQAFLWPPLVRLLNTALSEEQYSRLAPKISLSSSAGTLAVYLLSPLLITAVGWRWVFYLFAGFTALVALLWLTVTGRLLGQVDWKAPPAQPVRPARSHGNVGKAALIMAALLPALLLMAALQGVHRDGVTTWVPTLLSDSLHLPASRSILLVALLQVFPIISSLFTYPLLRRFRDDVFLCMAACCGAALLCLLPLVLLSPDSALVSVLFLAPVNMAVHITNTLQTVFCPRAFRGSPHLSLYTGGINFAVYVGSALSAWLLPHLADAAGWSAVLWAWVTIALLEGGVALFCVLYKRKKEREVA